MVVGGTSGIGLATARLLVEAGEQVRVVARSEERLRRVAADLGGGTTWAVADVSDPEAVQAAVDGCVAEHGRLDAVVSTAQPMAYGTVEQVPHDVLTQVVAVGVGGVGNLARSALPVFRSQGGGSLVVVGSLLGEIAVPGMGAYCAAKWGQMALVRALQVETRRERGVHVSLVLPGAVDTPVYHLAGSYAGSAGSAPPPIVAPEQVAKACVRLLDHPRRAVHVGPGTLLTRTGFRMMPAIYDRLAGPLVSKVALRGPGVPDHPGNVFAPRPDGESERGGWTPDGRLRSGPGRRARWRRR